MVQPSDVVCYGLWRGLFALMTCNDKSIRMISDVTSKCHASSAVVMSQYIEPGRGVRATGEAVMGVTY